MAGSSGAKLQADHLQKMLNIFQNMQTNEGRSLPCFNGWQISIKSLQNLWDDLSAHPSHTHILTNRLNQDCLENFFGSFRASGVTRDNPNAQQFPAAYRMICANQVFTHATGQNCETDHDKVLLAFTDSSISDTPLYPRESIFCQAASSPPTEMADGILATLMRVLVRG